MLNPDAHEMLIRATVGRSEDFCSLGYNLQGSTVGTRRQRTRHRQGGVVELFMHNTHTHEADDNELVMMMMQWDRYRIFRCGPRVPGCYNGEIQSFCAESGPFPVHFWNFSGLLVVIFVGIVKL